MHNGCTQYHLYESATLKEQPTKHPKFKNRTAHFIVLFDFKFYVEILKIVMFFLHF